MGIVLGLIGGGGSILTVPILVYLMHIEPVAATAYSLFVVGATSLVGAAQNLRKQLIDIKTAIIFAIPAFIAVYTTRKWIMPAIPQELLHIGHFHLTKSLAIMVLFAIVMIAASITMIKSKCDDCDNDQKPIVYNYPMIFLEGSVVGLLTGLIGAGGGFLIVPALVLFAKLPMRKAVATSLLIIAAKSLIGFIGDVENLQIDWVFLGQFTFLSILGIFLGIYFNSSVKGSVLKKYFGWFVLAMGIVILLVELFIPSIS